MSNEILTDEQIQNRHDEWAMDPSYSGDPWPDEMKDMLLAANAEIARLSQALADQKDAAQTACAEIAGLKPGQRRFPSVVAMMTHYAKEADERADADRQRYREVWEENQRLSSLLEQTREAATLLQETFPIEGERIGQSSPAIKHIRADFWGTHRSAWRAVDALAAHPARVAHGLLGDAGYSLRGDEDYDELLAVLKGADTLTGSSDNRDVQQVKYPIHLSRELRVERTVYSSGEGTNSYEYHVVDEDGATVAPHCESDNAEMALIETVEGLAGNRDYWKERAESAERLLQRETEQHDRERIFDDEQREILRRACAYPASDTEGSADEIEGMIESLPAAYKGRILKEIDDLRDRCEAAEHNLENWTREFGTSVLRVRTDLNEAHELAAHYRRDLDFAYAAERAMKERCASIAAEARREVVEEIIEQMGYEDLDSGEVWVETTSTDLRALAAPPEEARDDAR